ncbi:MAG TPA: BatA domain-containing protein [Saprospiraceae bacterium]|nr:BatA domain-containing protein [Saprospiraceae bacterium]
MNFLFPAFLWALALLSVPIIIHLFYFRRYKKVMFSNVQFLKQLVQETASKNKLKNILILLARLLALAALIFAFAQPIKNLLKSDQNAAKAVSIFVDNSYSMNAESSDGSLFNKSKKLAQDIIRAYGENDEFQIITHDLEGKQMRLLSKDDAMSLLEHIEITPKVNKLAKIYQRQKQTLESNTRLSPVLYWISDFQKSISQFPSGNIDSSGVIYAIPVQSHKLENLSVDTAYFVNPLIVPQQKNSIVYQVSNHGSSDATDVRCSYKYNQQEFPAHSLQIKAGKSVQDTIHFTATKSGWESIELKIQSYPITFDDTYYLSFEVKSEIEVLVIQHANNVSTALKSALTSLPYFKLSLADMNALDYNKFKKHQLIILNELPTISTGLASELKKSAELGTNVLIFPAPDVTSQQYEALSGILDGPRWNQFERKDRDCAELNKEQSLYQDVFIQLKNNIKLPATKANYELIGGRGVETILKYRDGLNFLNRYRLSNANLYVCASPLQPEYSDFSKNAELFVPFLFKAAIVSQYNQQSVFTIGEQRLIHWPMPSDYVEQERQLKIIGPQEFIPSVHVSQNQFVLDVYDQLSIAGIYQLMNEQQELGKMAFNQSRQESELTTLTEKELEDQWEDRVKILNAQDGVDFKSIVSASIAPNYWWKYLLLFALLFLFIETLLIRFWKN